MSNLDLQWYVCCGGPLLCPALFWSVFCPKSFSPFLCYSSCLLLSSILLASSPWFLWCFYWISLKFLWKFHSKFYGISMVFLWYSMVCLKMCLWYIVLWHSYGISKVCPWDFLWIPMAFLWHFLWYMMIWDFFGVFIIFLLDSYDIYMRLLWDLKRISMVFLWYF